MNWRRWSRIPFRSRLALAFGGLFLLSGGALLAFVVVLARYGTVWRTSGIAVAKDARPTGDASPTENASPAGAHPTPQAPGTSDTSDTGDFSETGDHSDAGDVPEVGDVLDGLSLGRIDATVQTVQDTALQQMLLWSTVGLVLITVLAALTGRWLAGRALRPVTAVTDTALGISENRLDERLDLSGPDDELHHLADAFDSMLGRLQRAFDSQRRFVANASHELRTPLAAQRASIEVGLADPLPADLAETRDELLTTNREAEQLIAALLLLARGERGLDHTEQVDLGETVDAVVTGLRPVARGRGLALRLRCVAPARAAGDPVLLRHLVTNLVDNALQYNRPGGYVEVALRGAALTVTNSGPPIDPDRVDDLFEPFRRLGQDRTETTGHGLGLSIVRSIAQAHGAALGAAPGPDGGLTVTVRLG